MSVISAGGQCIYNPRADLGQTVSFGGHSMVERGVKYLEIIRREPIIDDGLKLYVTEQMVEGRSTWT